MAGEAGWQADPTGRHEHRYWDGSQWTDHVADAGVSATDPFDAVADAPTTVEPVVNPYETPVSADPTATYPTAPAPPVPPTYAPAASPVSEGGEGSKKGFLIGLGILVAVAAAVVAFLALGGDDDTDGDRIASEDTTTTEDDGDESTSTTEDGFTDDDPFADGGIDEIPDDAKDQMVQVYMDSMGLDREQSECLVNRMVELIESGEMNEDEAFSDFMNYLDDCDISMEDLANN